ncbi:MAG: hypothetical protein H6553_11755 [Chitinophagales bacterium]|nr:hypothetical protein [Chitinophagales bacterium]
MKNLLILFGIFFLISTTKAQSLNGIKVPIIVGGEMTSKSKENTITFKVAEDIKDTNGKIIILKNTAVIASIDNEKARGIGRAGSIKIQFQSTQDINGTVIKLSGNETILGESNRKHVLGVGLGVGLGLFYPMLFYLVKKGGEAVLKSNTIISSAIILQNE